MLEIKHLTKIYRTKNNVITRALDDVSIKFPDKGMVFLLGKSGSGKSTLLNLCGGLDSADSGEIIIKGRSSKTFTNSDFDSYRNTYVGFVFQEYNILNEFSVEDNIAIALELQGKPKDKEKIQKILQDVELEEYATRKPNTLSGGQKQRIAIARALVKDPEIIMADEPTGALDSNTGRQVLETLKKLSNDKLVIVVSHDREFAEKYGDRIIELKDGKVILDVTKECSNTYQEGNLTIIDANTISIKKGQKLETKDLEKINNFLATSQDEVIISNSIIDVKKFKEVARINENSSKESFNLTDEKKIQSKEYKEEDAKFINSKLPWHHAFKIGVNSLKVKPVRLIFTIFLSMISFVFLGVVSTMTFYNPTSVTIKNLEKSDTHYYMISKGYKAIYHYYDDEGIESIRNTTFSLDEVANLQEEYNDVISFYNFQKNYTTDIYYNREPLTFENLKNEKYSSYYINQVLGFAYVDENNSLRDKIVAGVYPSNDNEIMLSTYTFETIKEFGMNNLNIEKYQDLIGQKIVFNTALAKEFTVTGIYDVSSFIDSKFNKLKEHNDLIDDLEDFELLSLWEEEIEYNICTLVLVNDNFYQANKDDFIDEALEEAYYDTYSNIYLENTNKDINPYELTYFANKEYRKLYDLSGNEVTNDQKDNLYLGTGLMRELINHYFATLTSDDPLYVTFIGEIIPSLDTFVEGTEYDKQTRINAYKKVYNFLNENNLIQTIFENYEFYRDESKYNNAKIAGFVIEDKNLNVLYTTSEIVNDLKGYGYGELDTNYQIRPNDYISGVFIKNDLSHLKLSDLVNKTQKEATDSSLLVINHYIVDMVISISEIVGIFSKVFLVSGIVLGIFAILLLSNFISISIANKQKEIGILRAVGARGVDVFKIFVSESGVIVGICFVISVIFSIISCEGINASVGAGVENISLLVFGIPSVILLLLISIFVAVVATFLPVYSIARKKPVDSIRAL